MASVPKPTVCRDPKWLAVVRTMPCINGPSGHCNTFDTIGVQWSEASHLKGKSLDNRVLPMCGGCHRTGRFAWHKGKHTFMAHFGWTEDELLSLAEALWDTYTTEGK